MMMGRWLFPVLTSFIVALGLGACSSGEKAAKTAEERFKLAQYYEENDRFEEAIRRYNEIRQEFPYSSWAVEAELKVADVYYKQESYAEAALAYEKFRDQYPTHAKTDYVLFQLGMSYFHQVPETVDRDLTKAPEAIQVFEDLLQSFPHSQYVSQAQEKRSELVSKLEEKIQYIADFYYKIGQYQSALGRYQELYQKAGSKERKRWAALRGAECAKKLGDLNRQKDWENVLKKLN